MSRRDQRPAEFYGAAPSGNWVLTSLLVGIVSLIAGGAGFFMPRLISSGVAEHFTWESLAGRTDAKKKPQRKPSGKQPVFVPFGDAVVNLAEERLTRQLHVKITLLAQSVDAEMVEGALGRNRAVLMNWLISYLSDKSLDEVRGAAGVNQTRRDIQDRFNSLLFADGSERVRDVLFEEFTVR